MVFNDTSTKDGIIQQIEFRTNIGDSGITGNATLFAQITGQVNTAYMNATRIIMEADGRWKWDDTNQTNLPTATTDISSAVSDYPVMIADPSDDQDWLSVERVEIKDNNGNWVKIPEIDQREELSSIGAKYTTAGVPSGYDFDGTSIILRPQPNYNSTGGIKLWFKRAPLEFAVTGTDSQRPGFATIFHEYLVLLPVYYWEKYKRVGDAEQTKRDIKEMEAAMKKHYGMRDKTSVKHLSRVSKIYD